MICLLGSQASTNEEYKMEVKRRIKLFIAIIILGIITFLISFMNERYHFANLDSWLNGLYSGFGSGLVLAGIIRIIMLRRLLKNDDKLKHERLKSTDERNVMITYKATKSAGLLMIFFSYIGMLVGGLISKTVFYCFAIIVLTFLLTYLGSVFYFQRIM